MTFILVLLILFAFLFGLIHSCPPTDLFPCLCMSDYNEVMLLCEGKQVNDVNLAHLLNGFATYLIHSPQTSFKRFRLANSQVSRLTPEVFGRIPFKEIELLDNAQLDLSVIDDKTFVSATNTLRRFYSERNLLLSTDGSELISTFNLFPYLEVLVIRDNNLKVVPHSAFGRDEQSNLRFIDLSFNQINRVEEFAFHELSTLSYLNLGNNNLTRLGENSLNIKKPSLRALQINLWVNQLTSNGLDVATFANVRRPLILNLQYNKLVYFSENVFRPLIENENNYEIDVQGNPFLCDCERHLWLFHLPRHLRVKLRNLVCSRRVIWDYESEVIRNCH